MKRFKIGLIALIVVSLSLFILFPRVSVKATPSVISISVGKGIYQAEPDLAMHLVFNPSGTHIDSKGYLKVRFDIYPSEADKCYSQYHVYVVDETSPEFLEGYKGKVDKEGNPVDPVDYQNWLDGLPHIWRVNPCLCHFITISPLATKDEIEAFIHSVLGGEVLEAVDDVITLPDSAHYISPLMLPRSVMSKAVNLKGISPSNELIVKDGVNLKLRDFQIDKKADGTILKIEPKSIDIGDTAINRSATWAATYTVVNDGNTANADGTIDTWEIWAASNLTGTKTGTMFLISGTTYECRDTESIGNVTSGSKQTFSGLSTNVTTGDKAATYFGTGTLERDNSGYTSIRYSGGTGDKLTVGLQTNFNTAYGADAVSLYGTGTESASVAITVSPTSYDFGTVTASSTPYSTTNYFTIDNTSTTQTDQTISVTTATWAGGVTWTHSDTATAGANTAGLLANKGGSWGSGDVIVKYSSPNYIAENQAASTDYSFGLKLIAPTSFGDGVQKTITVRVSAAAG